MSSGAAIRVEAVSKRFVIDGLGDYERLTEAIPQRLKRWLRRDVDDANRRIFQALQDVNFQIDRGECVGLIGNNGAGKSTLLKILCRIVRPTSGRVGVAGRIGCLLEVGTGFHPELTGRENVYLNGAILGMPNREIRRRFDEIVEFAEVADFIDMPVKRYSNGMLIRLGFSVAAHLDPDVLIIDEVLGVGDAAFQKKSLGKAAEFQAAGRTVVMVSHHLPMITAFCGRCLLLRGGRLEADGPPPVVIARHLAAAGEGALSWRAEAPPSASLAVRSLELSQAELADGESPRIDQTTTVAATVQLPPGRETTAVLIITDETRQAIIKAPARLLMLNGAISLQRVEWTLPANLLNDRRYVLHVELNHGGRIAEVRAENLLTVSYVASDATPVWQVDYSGVPVRPSIPAAVTPLSSSGE